MNSWRHVANLKGQSLVLLHVYLQDKLIWGVDVPIQQIYCDIYNIPGVPFQQ